MSSGAKMGRQDRSSPGRDQATEAQRYRSKAFMDFSTAVFSNQGNPFPEKTRTKGHYHPSRASPLTAEQKHTVLSPARLHPRGDPLTHLGDDSLSPADRLFLKGSQHLVAEPPNSAGSSSPFNESWPSTELSTSKTPEGATQEPMPEWTAEGWSSPFSTAHDASGLSDDMDGSPRDESVIAKYMERFRHGRPSSREERSKPVPEERKHFWWLQSSSVKRSSLEEELSRHTDGRIDSEYGVPNLTGKPLGLTMPTTSQLDGKVSSLKKGDTGASQKFDIELETLRIQERAARLLRRSESSLSSTAAVSSEGLGSSPLSCMTQSEEEAARKPFLQSLSDHATGAVYNFQWPKSLTPYQPALVLPTTRPEDDILFQWRLRRKMEQARDGILTGTTQMKSLSPPVCLSKRAGDVYEVRVPQEALRQGTSIDINKYSMPASVSTPLLPNLASNNNPESLSVPPHMHHFCDIVPCSDQAWQLASSRTGLVKGNRSQASAYHNDGHSRQKQRQHKSRSPQEASSDEFYEGSLDLTPVDHSPAERGLECHHTSDPRKYSTQKGPSVWPEVKGHEYFGSPKRRSSQPMTKGDQNSHIQCQRSKVTGTKRETVKPSSKSNDNLCDSKAGLMSSPQESERQDRTRSHATTDHRTTERDQVLTRVLGSQVDSHQRSTGKDCAFKKESNKYRAMQREPVPKEVTTHHRAMELECIPKEEISLSGRAREKRVSVQEKTTRQEATDHQRSVGHGGLVEETRKGESVIKGRRMAPPDSPVRTILGQVISETLFSPPTSPKHSREKLKPFSRKAEPSSAIQGTEECPRLQPLEVATQLLNDAEESDGTEFEDDPLLQVLRERRNAILQRLRDVDVIIAQLQNQTSTDGSEPK